MFCFVPKLANFTVSLKLGLHIMYSINCTFKSHVLNTNGKVEI